MLVKLNWKYKSERKEILKLVLILLIIQPKNISNGIIIKINNRENKNKIKPYIFIFSN